MKIQIYYTIQKQPGPNVVVVNLNTPTSSYQKVEKIIFQINYNRLTKVCLP